MNDNIDFLKYLKYKKKYNDLKKNIGGSMKTHVPIDNVVYVGVDNGGGAIKVIFYDDKGNLIMDEKSLKVKEIELKKLTDKELGELKNSSGLKISGLDSKRKVELSPQLKPNKEAAQLLFECIKISIKKGLGHKKPVTVKLFWAQTGKIRATLFAQANGKSANTQPLTDWLGFVTSVVNEDKDEQLTFNGFYTLLPNEAEAHGEGIDFTTLLNNPDNKANSLVEIRKKQSLLLCQVGSSSTQCSVLKKGITKWSIQKYDYDSTLSGRPKKPEIAGPLYDKQFKELYGKLNPTKKTYDIGILQNGIKYKIQTYLSHAATFEGKNVPANLKAMIKSINEYSPIDKTKLIDVLLDENVRNFVSSQATTPRTNPSLAVYLVTAAIKNMPVTNILLQPGPTDQFPSAAWIHGLTKEYITKGLLPEGLKSYDPEIEKL